MTMAKVSYIGLIRSITGVAQEEVTLSNGASLRQLLDILAIRHGDALRSSLLNREGKLRQLARINIDGKSCMSLGGLDVKLEGSQEISILLAVDPMQGG